MKSAWWLVTITTFLSALWCAWQWRRTHQRLLACRDHTSPSSPEMPGANTAAVQSEHEHLVVMKSFLDGIGNACFLLDERGHVLMANQEASDLFPRLSSLVNRPFFEVLSDPRVQVLINESRTHHARLSRSFSIVRRDGTQEKMHHYLIHAAPLILPGSSQHYDRVIICDESDQYETEQIRRDFVANASHELRTPLSIINGYLESMLDGLITEPAMVERTLTTMQKHVQRLNRIVEDMLTISRFESAHQNVAAQLRLESFSVADCVAETIERLALLIEQKGITVKTDFLPDQCHLLGDRYYWDQIFFNLVENAIKENSRPGLVIEIGMRTEEKEHWLWVKDNGIGIPRADLPFIFKRFYRVAKHHGSEIKGTGLGLSIVTRAVEAHHGQIRVESVPGEMTRFDIRVPREIHSTPVSPEDVLSKTA